MADLVSNSIESYLLRPRDLAGEDSVLLLAVVTSAPGNAEARAVLRRTWAKHRPDLDVVFLCGIHQEAVINERLALEAAKYGDILQDNFTDHYLNLTLKSVSMLKWLNKLNTGRFKFAFKVDDDMFVDIEALLARLEQCESGGGGADASGSCRSDRPFCAGYQYSGVKAYRCSDAKYFLPRRLHGTDTLPPFLSGTAYVVSRAAVAPLLHHATITPYINLEDVFTTGLVATAAQVPIFAWSDFQRGRPVWRHPCLVSGHVTIHGLAPAEIAAVYSSRHACRGGAMWSVMRQLVPWQV